MHRRRFALLLMLLLITPVLTGCWSKQEIETGNFATMVAIDKAEDGGIELTVNLAITEALGGGAGASGGGGGGGSDKPAWTISSSGKNLAEAIATLETFSGRLPFWFHVEALVIGEDLAKDGISSVLDYMLRNRDFRLTTWVLVAEGKAKDILQLSPKITKLPARYLRDLIAIADEGSVSHPVQLLGVIHGLVEDRGTQVYIPLIHAKPKEPGEGSTGAAGAGGNGSGQQGQSGASSQPESPEALVLEGSAIFVGDKMVGKLNGLETRGMLWLRGESKRAVVVVDMPDGYVVEQQISARRTLKLTRTGDQLKATITVFQDGDILEHNMPHLEINSAALKPMDAALAAQIKQEADAALKKLQGELKSDTLGIGTRAYRLFPVLYNSQDWQQTFPTLSVEVVVHANFRRTGEALESPLTSKSSGR